MPYIEQQHRDEIDAQLQIMLMVMDQNLSKTDPVDRPGQLNYVITKLLHHFYVHGRNQELAQLSYANINEATGVLECVKQELYRRYAIPYEDQKIEQNGDV